MGDIQARVGVNKDQIFLYGEVGNFPGGISASAFIEALERVRDAESVTIHVNSPGGDVFEAQAILSAMRRMKARKTVIVDGLAASAASVICMGADKVIMSPGSMMMIHMPFTMLAGGTAEDLREKAAVLEGIADSIVGIYAAKTGKSPDLIREWMQAETWMNAQTALERGFCDAIEGEEEPKTKKADAQKDKAPAHARALLGSYRHAPTRAFLLVGETITAANCGEEKAMKDIFAALGLPEDAEEAKAVERISALCALEADAIKITNAATGADALTVMGKQLKESAAQMAALTAEKEALSAKVAALEAAQVKAEIAGIIDSLRRDGKLVPAQEDWAKNLGEKDLSQLKAFAASAPVIVSMKGEEEPAPQTGMKPFAEMSVDEKAALYASNHELYEKLKNG